jgi:phosphoribosylformylglycinamidine synthase
VHYVDESRDIRFTSMLKETIFAATKTLRARMGADDWCVSVFKDNAGIVKFDDTHHVCFKVETHNRPSALEPYGGANTGLGGVIRDSLGTGLGAKPIANTDVFCFAPPDTPYASLPEGVLHPRVVMTGVVNGVRDYGNRMGIPTVNGALFFDERYIGNPLVFCGNVATIPVDMVDKTVHPGDLIVSIGGRTGRDGIHGATFSSVELSEKSEHVSGGAVQIGDAITEKMLMDVLLQARDLGLYHAVTDCGAGGFSSAVGEMGAESGAEVWLDRAPLKYSGLTYTEIWISEAQERMVLAVPPDKWAEFHALCAAEGVEASTLGTFTDTGRLVLKYQDRVVADLAMSFLHDGRPPVVREARYQPPAVQPLPIRVEGTGDLTGDLRAILGSLNVCSKEWVIRQYDHEVQAGSVVKPLVGEREDGPSDAAVVRPNLASWQGLAISNGMNPRYGDSDPYWMAASAIDEAVRNCVAVGADPSRIAILDNFCWGKTDRPETLGSLVRAALGCQEIAIAYGTPFISGKDSLNNEFLNKRDGEQKVISIPGSLLISALGIVPDIRRCVTMDLKRPGNRLFLVGATKDELGGSHWALVRGLSGGEVPKVDAEAAPKIFAAVHRAISAGQVRACHDLNEGGLAAALAEMCFAGEFGARVSLKALSAVAGVPADPVRQLFSESNTRFVLEATPENVAALVIEFAGLPFVELGEVTADPELVVTDAGDRTVLRADWSDLKECWQQPLRW